MKLRDYRKIQQDRREESIQRYCEENCIDIKEYKKAEKKQFTILYSILFGAVVALYCLIGVASCSSNKRNDTVTTTPVVQKVLEREPLCAYESENQYSFVIHNETNFKLDFQRTTGADSVRINPQSETTVYVDNTVAHTMYEFYTINDEYFYTYYMTNNYDYTQYSPDYGTYFTIDSSSIDFDDLYIMPILNEKSYYLDFSKFDTLAPNTNFTKGLLGYDDIETDRVGLYGVSWSMGRFKPNFKNEYVNIQGDISYNMLRIQYEVLLQGYGFKYKVSVWAENTANDKTLMLLSNVSNSYVSIERKGDEVYFVSSNTEYYGDRFYLAPYLKDSALISEGSYLNLPTTTSSNNYPYTKRVLFSSNPVTYSATFLEESNTSTSLWSSFGDLFLSMWTAITPIFNIQVLPMISIGGLIIAPLILSFMAFILAIIKK